MATTYTKVLLSGSTQGAGIKVTGTASGSHVTVHTTGTSSTTIDEVWIYATNTSASAVALTIEYGRTTSPDNTIIQTIAPQSGMVLCLPGLVLTGSGSVASSVYAFAGTGNVIVVYGFVNRITP